MKYTYLILSFCFPLFAFTQEGKLPTQQFNYPATIDLDQLYRVKLEKPYTVYSDPKLQGDSKQQIVKKNKVLFLKELIFVNDLTEDPIERLSYEKSQVILVRYENEEGYVYLYENRSILKVEKDISDWIKAATDKYFATKRIEREKFLIGKYGEEVGPKLANLGFEEGMSKEMIIDAMGPADDINVSQGDFGKHEQIIYKNFRNLNSGYGYEIPGGPIYFYTENGLLKSIQY